MMLWCSRKNVDFGDARPEICAMAPLGLALVPVHPAHLPDIYFYGNRQLFITQQS